MDSRFVSILPFIFLNTMMNDEYREAVVRRVLNFRQDPKHQFQRGLEQTIRNLVTVKGGFQDPLKAPIPILAKEIIIASQNHNAIMGAILKVWTISQADLAGKIKSFLIERGLRAFDFKNGWDGFLESIDSYVMEEKAKEFVKEFGDYEFNDVALMICCQHWGASQGQHKDTPANKNGKGDEVTEFNLNSKQLKEEILKLKADYSKMSEQLAQAATLISNPGILPTRSFDPELNRCQKRFNELRDIAFEKAKLINALLYPEYEKNISLGDLEIIVNSISEYEIRQETKEKVRSHALTILDRVLRISHKDKQEFSPLNECHFKARELIKIISEAHAEKLPEETQLLAENKHPYCDLLALVDRNEELTDEQWDSVKDSIAKYLGSAMAIAALRGRFVIPRGAREEKEKEISKPKIISEKKSPNEFTAKKEITSPVDVSEGKKETAQEVITQKLEEEKDIEPSRENLARGKTPYNFPPEETAQMIAKQILDRKLDLNISLIPDLIWRLIYESNLSLAYHLARDLEKVHIINLAFMPSSLIRATSLGMNINQTSGLIANILTTDFPHLVDCCFLAGNYQWNHAVRFILIAAAARPALLAPNTGASSVLHSLRFKDGLNKLYGYSQVIANYGDRLQALDPLALKKVKSEAAWNVSMDKLHEDLRIWISQAHTMTTAYAPATAVWHKWLSPDGVIHSLMATIKNNEIMKLNNVKREFDRLSDENQVKKEVEYTDHKILKRRGGDAITAKALGQLKRHLREAVGFAKQWIELHENKPGENKGFAIEQAENVRKEISSRKQEVLEEMNTFANKNSSIIVMAGVSLCKKAIENISNLFDPEEAFGNEEPEIRDLLHSDLLKIGNIGMNEQWEPEDSNYTVNMKAIVEFVARGYLDWDKAFMLRCDSRDHEATERIIEYLKRNPGSSFNLREMVKERDKNIRECLESLEADIEITREEVEKAVAFGLLKEKNRERYIAKIEEIKLSLPNVLRFYAKRKDLAEIREEILKKWEAEINSVKERLNALDANQRDGDIQRIHLLLEKRDVFIANEYIDMVLTGQPLPEEATEEDPFIDYFPEKANALADYMERAAKPHAIIKKVRERENFCGIDMKRVPGAQTDQAAEMLEQWFAGKNAQKIDESAARKILHHLGFIPYQVSVNKAKGATWVQVNAEPILDKERCPVPFYGSRSEGRYRVLCVWDRPTEEDLLNMVGETLYGNSALVFHFGRMTEQRRRDLARLCRERRRTFVVIDDTLILYLCGERGSRLPIMFECSLPFTFVEPYVTTAGIVPPEVFYGRKRERDSIIDPLGSCFIYGGRQLGKTALLRDVERAFHMPKEGRVALWIDLKAHGFGYDRPIDGIWNLLAEELKKLEIVPANMPAHASNEKLLSHMEKWSEEINTRRILLLLDEADRFLERDAKEDFVRATALKGLMDRTSRRFKVIFAGLHNVQRTTRLENHPLAHYGEPICIGPLLDNGEWREARDLVKRPFASIGFRFESLDLVSRIISQTNYYPNLIQLYCNQMLRHVNNPKITMFDAKTSPPYILTSQHVEDAYKNQELRKGIRDRFMWTLDLDPRYRVIAFSMALYTSVEGGKGISEGFSLAWIKNQALTWWPEGFRESTTEDRFRSLLEEMVGLGILRKTIINYYSLRSPNLISLLGTKEEIEAELESNLSRESPPEYEAATFRTSDRNESWRRNPLTVQQESDLKRRENGVSIIFGCEVAGLSDLEKFLTSSFGSEFFISAAGILDKANFTRRLEDLGKREKDGITLVCVPCTCPWSELWVEEAIVKSERLKSKSSFVRILFIADAKTTWQIVNLDNDILGDLVQKRVTIFSLSPWHDSALWQWLDTLGFGPSDKAGRKKIGEVTGNWPLLLQMFHDDCRAESHLWERCLQKLSEKLKNPEIARNMAEKFGIVGHERQKVLSDLSALEEASLEDLAEIVEGISVEKIKNCLKWAELLNLARPAGNEKWRIDMIARQLLERMGK